VVTPVLEIEMPFFRLIRHFQIRFRANPTKQLEIKANRSCKLENQVAAGRTKES
jgi:hypothetical protein